MAVFEFNPQFQPKQLEFFSYADDLTHSVVGMGGSRGGGKSKGGRDVMLSLLLKWAGTRGLIIAETYPKLEKNHIAPILDEWPQLRSGKTKSGFEYGYIKADKKLTLPNKSVLYFGHMENFDDYLKYRGQEFTYLYLEEATEFHQQQIEWLMRTVVRYTGPHPILPKTIMTCNPGGPGHDYIKRILVDRIDYEPHEDPRDYAFIHSRAWDNFFWFSKRDLLSDGMTEEKYRALPEQERIQYFITHANYGKQLAALPEDQREAELYGNWNVFVGQFFKEWRDQYHVSSEVFHVEHDESGNPVHTVAGGLDYGRHSVLTLGVMDGAENITIIGESVTTDMVPEDRARAAADLVEEKRADHPSVTIYFDTDMDLDLKWYRGYGKKPIDVFKTVFTERFGAKSPRFVKVAKRSSKNKQFRQACNEQFRSLLAWRRDETGALMEKPRILFGADCKKCTTSIPALIHDRERPGLDFADGQWDHAFDSVKYLVMPLRIPNVYADVEEKADMPGTIAHLLKNLPPSSFRYDEAYAPDYAAF